jgi:ribosomal protein S18 acetylase RimI-like enzyme
MKLASCTDIPIFFYRQKLQYFTALYLLKSRYQLGLQEPVSICYASIDRIPAFHSALSTVAREKVYLDIIEAPPVENVVEFQTKIIHNNWPAFYAVAGERVVGWVDIHRLEAPRRSHRGNLGMGLIPEARRQGLGSRLLQAALDHAVKIGLEKIELTVYTSNLPALGLYKKFGFEPEGLLRSYRRVDGFDFDGLLMAKFL